MAVSLAKDLRRTRWDRGCPVATTALETLGRSAVLQQAAMEVIDGWVGLLTARFIDAGVSKEASAELATNVISVLEGAELLARICRSDQPLLRAGRALRAVAASVVA